jgi:DNA-directed RNA polymerase subunit K/omega
MSDNEDDYSVTIGDGDSDGESENYKKPNIIKNKKVNARPTISDYDDDDDGDDDDNDDIRGGGDDDEDEDDETKLDENQEDDDEVGNENVVDDDDDDEVVVDDDDEDLYEDDEDEDDDDDNDDDDEEDDDETGNKTMSGGVKTTKNKGKQVKPDKKQATIQLDTQINDYDDDDDDDYQDDNYLQKFDKEITKDYIMDFHPECLNHNYDEIKALSKVTRDEFNIIIDPLHKTIPFLTKYEKARILGQRSKQIECGAKPLVKVPENIIDSYLIAELELEQKAMPFIIRRPIPSGGSEYWNLKDLEYISF